MGSLFGKPERKTPPPAPPAPSAPAGPPTRAEWQQIIYNFKYERDKMVTKVESYTQSAELLRRRYHETLTAGRKAEAERLKVQVQSTLALLKMVTVGERKARENLHAVETQQMTNEMFAATKSATALLKQLNQVLTPEMIEEAEVEKAAAMKQADACVEALLGGQRREPTTGADVDAFLASLGQAAEPAGPAPPVPVELIYAGSGAAAAPQQRQSARVAEQRQLAEA